MRVGVRELKAHLSEYLDQAARGAVIHVTRRGDRVAQLGPVVSGDRLDQGLAEGWITRDVDEPPRTFRPSPPRSRTPSSEAIIRADRDGR